MDALNSLWIESHRGKQVYDRMVFGQFLEHFHRQVYGGAYEPGSPLADQRGFRLDVIEALKELRVPIVRWPGGCFVSAYHWKDGVGPERRPSFDKAWRVEDPNTFGTDEFIEWCRAIGAEPYICTNAGTGTPEEMSDWVEYCNLKSEGYWARLRQGNGYADPHGVRYWSIGNENYGDWEIGAKTREEWGYFVAESAKMMKRVDPDIQLLAAALADVDWTLNLLRRAGRYLDYVSIHGYYDRLALKDEPSDYATCMMRTLEPEKAILTTEQIIAIAGFSGQIRIAFDEWNLRGWHHPRANFPGAIAARDRNDLNATYTMADAVFSACFLNTCLRHPDSVRMANMAPVINTRGPLFVHPKGIVRRTTFHVLAMYSQHLQSNVVNTHVVSQPYAHLDKAVPALDCLATCDDAMREWTIAVVNRDPAQAVPCQLNLADRPVQGEARMICLAGSGVDDYNDIDAPSRVVPQESRLQLQNGMYQAPAHSVSLIRVSVP